MLAVIALLLVVAVAVLAVLLSGGVYATYPRSALQTAAQQQRAPAWTLPCRRIARSTLKPACVRVTGRVVWIQHHDDDGDGDRHLVVISRRRVHIVKIPLVLPVPHLPRIGTRIDAVGWLALGASGHYEVDTERYVAGGVTTWRRSGG